MSSWTHLIRFKAKEDGQVHLGQLVDSTRDIGLDYMDGVEIKAFLLNGDIYNGTVTEQVLTVDYLLAPVDQGQCNFIRCLGLNYRDHAEEGNFPIPSDLEVFTKPRTALTGPFPAAITIPKCAQDGSSDYEAELCVVIRKAGRDIPENRALNYVLGYTAANDVSARNLQLAVKQWSFSKGLDNSCPTGPVLVSPSTIPNPQSLGIKAIYDGQTVQNGNTTNMIFSVAKQVSCLSRGTTLEAGSIILTGTPAGIGYFKKPRCDGGYPSCFHCQDTDERCEYRTSSHREQQEAISDNTLVLEQRLKLLEDTVQRLRNTSFSTAEESDECDSPQLVIQDLPENFLYSSNDQDGGGSTGEEFYGPSSNIFYLRQILGEIDSATLSSFRGTDSKISGFIKPECSPPAAVFHMESVPVARHADNEDLYILPPNHATRSLVELFFRDYGSMNPFLDKQTFIHTHVDPIYEGTIPPDPSKLALLDMVLAIATASSVDSITPATRRFLISRLFFERSKNLLSKDAFECGNLEQVQSYLLMTVQKALRQGLHNEDYLATDLSPEKEAKRRTWQLCLFMDSAFSMHFGRPSLLGPFKERAGLFVNQPLPVPAARSSPSDRWPDEESSTFFYLSFKLYAILGQIVSTEYFQSPKPLDLSQFMDIIASITCMSQKLDDWLDSLPEKWQASILDSSAAPVDEAESQHNLYRVLGLRYHNVRLMLHRPALVLVLSAVRKSANPNDMTRTSRRRILLFSRPSLDTSIESAEAIVATINAFEGGKPGPGMWWTLIQIVYNATLTCFALICLQTKDAAFGGFQAVSKARACIDLARQAFWKLVPDHPAVERASSFLRHISRLCDHIVQQNVSASLVDSVPNISPSQADTECLGPESFPFDFSIFESLNDPLFTYRQNDFEKDADA
ncbi:uncharacterized protein FTJAE_13291 [Fusarium tjaetaba]|uniref:Transcription factor domain-containing protein n=1 Tax=Fusarium tjaetaba TaxID=1567544 RepID=A0A8H5VBX7_9HYPO|nr:uncharacterized protein FTJAE_13291 [Fusarium tjaetaba]KAF5615589.1 hypothetical protein FTJAE_13291 [Fusarium tjaetaba]